MRAMISGRGTASVQLVGIALFILLHEFPELEEVGVQGTGELPKNNAEVAMNCLGERFVSVQALLEKLKMERQRSSCRKR
jgi:hypothetical protein